MNQTTFILLSIIISIAIVGIFIIIYEFLAFLYNKYLKDTLSYSRKRVILATFLIFSSFSFLRFISYYYGLSIATILHEYTTLLIGNLQHMEPTIISFTLALITAYYAYQTRMLVKENEKTVDLLIYQAELPNLIAIILSLGLYSEATRYARNANTIFYDIQVWSFSRKGIYFYCPNINSLLAQSTLVVPSSYGYKIPAPLEALRSLKNTYHYDKLPEDLKQHIQEIIEELEKISKLKEEELEKDNNIKNIQALPDKLKKIKQKLLERLRLSTVLIPENCVLIESPIKPPLTLKSKSNEGD